MAKITTLKSFAAEPDNTPMEDEKRWQAESDLDALIRAAKIKRDKERFRAAMAVARERKKELDNISRRGSA